MKSILSSKTSIAGNVRSILPFHSGTRSAIRVSNVTLEVLPCWYFGHVNAQNVNGLLRDHHRQRTASTQRQDPNSLGLDVHFEHWHQRTPQNLIYEVIRSAEIQDTSPAVEKTTGSKYRTSGEISSGNPRRSCYDLLSKLPGVEFEALVVKVYVILYLGTRCDK